MALHGGGHLLCDHQWRPAAGFCYYLLQNCCCRTHTHTRRQADINTKYNLKNNQTADDSHSFPLFLRCLLSLMRTFEGKGRISSHCCLLSLGSFLSSLFSYRCGSINHIVSMFLAKVQLESLLSPSLSLDFIQSSNFESLIYRHSCVSKSREHVELKVASTFTLLISY